MAYHFKPDQVIFIRSAIPSMLRIGLQTFRKCAEITLSRSSVTSPTKCNGRPEIMISQYRQPQEAVHEN
jgi:hypothetical protein